jgi:hypothetical protein
MILAAACEQNAVQPFEKGSVIEGVAIAME